ncbi:MAG: hypothetical protein ACJ8LG_05710 [Massilia sp.]
MFTVTITDIVRLRHRSRFPIQSWRQLRRLAVTLALGLPALMLAFHLLDPAAPLAYVVAPVLVGGLLPLFLAPPGQFEVASRATDAGRLAGALEHAIEGMGYVRTATDDGALRYRAARQGWLGWHDKEVRLTTRGQAIHVSGPVAILHALRERIARHAVPLVA